MNRGLVRLLNWVSGLLLFFYCVYVAGSAIVLNTKIFRNLASMDDDELTYVQFKGAISPFPGILYIHHGEVFISDQNVSIRANLMQTWADFDFKPFFKSKTINVSRLHTKTANVNLGFKSLAETTEFVSKHTRPKDLDLDLKRKIAEGFKKTHIILDFKHIMIDTITELSTSHGKFSGRFNLDGGFMIQPGAQVQVYPTTLKIINVSLPGEFEELNGVAKTNFDRFFIPDAPGNAAFPFINGTLELEGKIRSLKFLNLSLKTLPEYEFDGTQANVKVRMGIDHGKLVPGSYLVTSPSDVYMSSPDMRASGHGQVYFLVREKDRSSLTVKLHKVRLLDPSKPNHQGIVKNLDLKLNLFGNNMVDSFHGLAAEVKLAGLQFKMDEDPHSKSKLHLSSALSGDGKIFAIAGFMPTSDAKYWKERKSALKLNLESLAVKTEFLPPVQVAGTINITATPLDFSTNALVFPEIETLLKISVEGKGTSDASIKLTNTSYMLAPLKQWKGVAEFKLKKTDPFVEALKDKGSMSGIVAGFAKVEEMSADLEWEVGNAFSWFHFSKINSTGIWKAYGSLLNKDEEMTGAFEISALQFPIGVKVSAGKTEVSFSPKSEWYPKIMH